MVESNLRQSEDDLVASLKAGEESAYEALIREHGGYLLTIARRVLNHEEDAREAVQEAFVSAFRSIGRFQGESALRTWLHRIVVNAALMRLRRKRRKPERLIEDLQPRFDGEGHRLDVGPAWSMPVDAALRRAELRDVIIESIAQLPEDYRTVLLLRDIEELSTREAAESLGISEGATKVRLHRARLALRELLDPHLREDGS